MATSVSKIAKNAGILLGSQLTTWALSLLLAVMLPRYLGAELIGEIAIATSIWLILSVLISFGMDLHLTKSVARDPAAAGVLLGTSLAVRLVLAVVACMLVAAYALGTGYNTRVLGIIAIIGAAQLITVLGNAYGAVLNGLERMGPFSMAVIASKVITTAGSALMILLQANVFVIVSLNVISALLALILLCFYTPRQYRFQLQFSGAGMWAMLLESRQYLVTALVLVAYQQVDKLFIVALVDTKTVGWYSTAMNLFGTLMFIPGIFGAAVLPALARGYAAGDDGIYTLTRRGLDFMFLLSVPIGFGLFVIADPLVLMLYGEEFTASGAILSVLGIVLILTYLNTFLGQILISTDRTARWNAVMLSAVLLTVPLDLVLVPWTRDVFNNGGLGGATAFLFTEAIMVFGAILLMPKGTLQWVNVRRAALTLLCGLLMVASIWWWREQMLLPAIIVGAFVYCGSVVLLRVVPREDLLLLREAGMRVISKLRGRKEVQAGVGD